MLKLNYDAAHRFVEGYPQASWDGWTMVISKPDNRGATNRRGALVDGKWHMQTRVDADDTGVYRVRV